MLLATLNTLFCSSVSILIVYLAARSYLATGSRAVLLLGCGSMIIVIINLLAGILLTEPNVVLTIYNTGLCLAGLCFLGSALWAITSKPRETVPAKASSYLHIACLSVLVGMGLVILGTLAGITPTFFVPGHGSTLLRQIVLYLILIEFVLASACFGILYRQSRTPFLLWYSLGLLLIGMGMGILIFSNSIGTLTVWAGRGGQYLGSLYMLVAVWSLRESRGDLRVPLEKALKETEEKYRTIVETAKEGIWVIDGEGNTTFVNSRMAEMLGVSREELLGKGVSAFTDEEGLALAWQKLEQRRQGEKESHEYKFIRKDGSALWALVSSSPQHDKDRKFTGSTIMITDITGRKRTEEALRANERDLSRAQSIAHLGFWVWDVNKDTLQWSDETYRILGLSSQQIAPDYNTFLEFVHPGDREKVNRSVAEAINGTMPYDVEWRVLRRDGSIRYAHSQGEVIAESGKPIRMIGTILDITERKRTEEALWASKEELIKANNDLRIKQEELRVQAVEREVRLEELRATNEELEKVTGALRESEETARQHAEELKKLMDLVPAAIWVSHDPQCHVISGNKAANKFYEAREGDNVSAGPGDIQQDTTRRFFRNGKELMPDELTMQEAAAKGVDVLNSELEVLLPSGRQMTILGNASPLLDSNGKVRGCVAAFVDITDRKRAEKDLFEAKMQAELYLDLMGHDINNMHQIAIGYLELAREMRIVDESQRYIIDKPLETMQRSAKLIDNVRKLQKVQAGELEQDAVDLDDVLKRVIDEYKDITGEKISYNNEQGPHRVMANELLYDVFANLIGNAIKHSGGYDSNICVSIDRTGMTANGIIWSRSMTTARASPTT